MKTYQLTQTTTEPLLSIRYDSDCTSPREWSNLGYFITVDRHYTSPDQHERLENIVKNSGEIAKDQADHIRLIKENYHNIDDKIIAIYPVVKYEHSGVVYRLGTTHGFDYSNNGFYIVTKKTQKELGTKKKDFERVIKDELEVYTQWVNGEVYNYTLYNEQGEVEDSCGGFYSLDEIKGELPDEWKNEEMRDYLKD